MAPVEAHPINPTDLLRVNNPRTDEKPLVCSLTVKADETIGISVRHIDENEETQSTTVLGTQIGGCVKDGEKHHFLHHGETVTVAGVLYTGVSSGVTAVHGSTK